MMFARDRLKLHEILFRSWNYIRSWASALHKMIASISLGISRFSNIWWRLIIKWSDIALFVSFIDNFLECIMRLEISSVWWSRSSEGINVILPVRCIFYNDIYNVLEIIDFTRMSLSEINEIAQCLFLNMKNINITRSCKLRQLISCKTTSDFWRKFNSW